MILDDFRDKLSAHLNRDLFVMYFEYAEFINDIGWFPWKKLSVHLNHDLLLMYFEYPGKSCILLHSIMQAPHRYKIYKAYP